MEWLEGWPQTETDEGSECEDGDKDDDVVDLRSLDDDEWPIRALDGE